MLKRTRRHLWRLAVLLGKLCATTVALVFVAFTLLIWRANQGPIVIDSLAPQLAQLLSNPDTGIHTVVDHAQLAWDRGDQALRLQTAGVRVFDRNGHRLAHLPRLDLGLNFLASLRGQLAPFEIHASDITMRLTRLADGGMLFGEVPLEGAPDTPPLTHADITQLVQESLQLRPAWFGLGRIGAVRLARVHIVIADGRNHTDWGTVSLPRLDLVRRLADLRLTGTVTAQLGGAAPATLQLSALHNHRRGDLQIETELSAFNPQPWLEAFGLQNHGSMAAQLHGTVNIRLDENVVVQQVELKLQSKDGQLNLPQLWPQPQPFTALALQAQLEPARRKFSVTEATLNLDGVKLAVKGTAAPITVEEFDLQAEAAVKDWPLDKVAALWPASVAPNPRAWIVAHMSHGVFRSATAKLQARGDWLKPAALRDTTLQATLALDNATVNYLDGMPPVTGISGEATADQDSLHIKTKGGKAENVALSDSSITIAGLSAEHQTMAIRLTAQSKISDVMRLIDHQPLNYAGKLGLKPDAIGGKADLELKLDFPLLKDLSLNAMQIAGKAKLQDMASDQLVKSLAITGGDLDLEVDAQKLGVVGTADFNGVRLAAEYRQNFSGAAPALAAKASLRGKLTAEAMHKLGLPMPADLMTGAAPTQFDYEQPFAGAATLAAQADFTPARLQLPRLGWDKPEQQTATARVKLVLNKEQPVLQEVVLSGEGLNARLQGTFTPDLQLRELTCKPCKVGRSDFTAQLGFQAGRLRDIALSGPALDWRSATEEKATRPSDAKEEPLPLNVTLNLEKFYRAPQAYFTAVRGTLRRDAVGWDKMELRAVAMGRVPVTVALLPQANKTRKFSVVTDDLGDVLRAADITDQVHEGKLLITGNSAVQEPYRIMGKIQLKNYRVRKLPALAVLLNAVSITGLADLMAGEGLNFDQLEGGFDWNRHRLGLDDVRTAGGALGLNVEGEIDFAADKMNLRGTVVPFSFFNAVIGVIPIVGDVLTGGKGGGVVAATYEAKGKLDDPTISVNPVSFLAPGILRRIFFQN